MEQSFHYILMATQALLQKRLLEKLKDTGLTAGQPKVLDYLHEHNGANQKEIANGCHIEAGSLTSLLNRMENGGLVERRMPDGDRRTYHIYLTGEGKRLSDIVDGTFRELEAQIFSGIPENDRVHFQCTAVRIYENLAQKKEEK